MRASVVPELLDDDKIKPVCVDGTVDHLHLLSPLTLNLTLRP